MMMMVVVLMAVLSSSAGFLDTVAEPPFTTGTSASLLQRCVLACPASSYRCGRGQMKLRGGDAFSDFACVCSPRLTPAHALSLFLSVFLCLLSRSRSRTLSHTPRSATLCLPSPSSP
jgi:hypothetical protein